MEDERIPSLEQALAKTESDADAVLKAATNAVGSLKKFRSAAKTGNLRELRRSMEAAEQAILALRERLTAARDGWNFDEETYFSSSAFYREVLDVAGQRGLKIFEQDDRLYCYPLLIRVLPGERAILIDKTKERRLRPSVLVDRLKDLQNRPVRFRSENFLDSLSSAYLIAVKTRGKDRLVTGAVVPLLEIYNLFTLLPGQPKEYPTQEFARDLYLVDQSGVMNTKNGWTLSLHPARGTETARKVFSIVTKEGEVKRYYGISFTQTIKEPNQCT